MAYTELKNWLTVSYFNVILNRKSVREYIFNEIPPGEVLSFCPYNIFYDDPVENIKSVLVKSADSREIGHCHQTDDITDIKNSAEYLINKT